MNAAVDHSLCDMAQDMYEKFRTKILGQGCGTDKRLNYLAASDFFCQVKHDWYHELKKHRNCGCVNPQNANEIIFWQRSNTFSTNINVIKYNVEDGTHFIEHNNNANEFLTICKTAISNINNDNDTARKDRSEFHFTKMTKYIFCDNIIMVFGYARLINSSPLEVRKYFCGLVDIATMKVIHFQIILNDHEMTDFTIHGNMIFAISGNKLHIFFIENVYNNIESKINKEVITVGKDINLERQYYSGYWGIQ